MDYNYVHILCTRFMFFFIGSFKVLDLYKVLSLSLIFLIRTVFHILVRNFYYLSIQIVILLAIFINFWILIF